MDDGKIGHRVPRGYDFRLVSVFEPNKDADKVRRVFDLYLKKREIKAVAQSIGWSASTIAYMLRNEFYYKSEKPLVSESKFKKVQDALRSAKESGLGRRYSKRFKGKVLRMISGSKSEDKTIKDVWKESGLPSKCIPYNSVVRWKKHCKEYHKQYLYSTIQGFLTWKNHAFEEKHKPGSDKHWEPNEKCRKDFEDYLHGKGFNPKEKDVQSAFKKMKKLGFDESLKWLNQELQT